MATISHVARRRAEGRARTAPIGIAWRPLTLIVSVVVAYFFSLSGLIGAMKYDTPLAYLGLVPPIAFALGCYRYRRAAAAPRTIGPLDAAAGGALLMLATLMAVGLPVALDAYAWSKRLDLLSVPIFAAGLVILLYGTSALTWAWPALAYGFLIWPVPYDFLLGHLLNPLTDWTAWVVARFAHFLPLGAAIDPTDGTVFTIATPSGAQGVSIGSACSGFNSLVAWILIGIALCVIVRGKGRAAGGFATAGRLALWLLLGTALTLLSNVARILALFAVAHRSGLDATFSIVHAALGTALFAIIVAALLLLLSRFGLTLPVVTRAAPRPAPAAEESPFPVQAAFLAFGGLILAAGALIGLGIFQMVIAFILLFLLCLLFTRDYYPDTAQAVPLLLQLQPPPSAPVGPLRMIGVAVGGVGLAVGAYAASRYAALHTDAIQSLGWRIGAWQQDILSGAARFVGAAALLGGALVVAVLIVRAPRFSPDAEKPLRLRPLTGPVGAGLIALIVLTATGTLALANVTVASFGGNATATSVPAGDFDALTPDVPGLQRAFVESYDWPKQFLGATSTYSRYSYDADGAQPFWFDIVTTEDAAALAYHKVQNCYAFHGYIDEGEREIGIGNGVTAQIVNYVKPDVNQTWSTLYWEQRIQRDGRLFYQRVVMLYSLQLAPGESVTGSRFLANNAVMQSHATQVLGGLIAPPTT
ncbi:MAG: exosortase/archaeosortase family protein [Chloroflexota bacterium]|nr:exosortase/archaeosortase family protein [Chloroflexota bacterium]